MIPPVKRGCCYWAKTAGWLDVPDAVHLDAVQTDEFLDELLKTLRPLSESERRRIWRRVSERMDRGDRQ